MAENLEWTMESEKIKKGGWKYDAGEGLVKREGASTFPI